MALVKWKKRDEWEPFRDLLNLEREIRRLFDFSFSRLPQRFGDVESFAPLLELYENDKEYVVEAELAGLNQNDINVEIEDNILTISGEKKREEKKGSQDKGFYRSERFYGKFQRSVALPKNIIPEKIKATYKNGLLKISIPKNEDKKSTKIDVKVE